MSDMDVLRDLRSDVAPDTATAKLNARSLLDARMRHRSPNQRRNWLLRGGIPATIGAVALAIVITLNPFSGSQSGASAAAAEFQAMASTASRMTTPSMAIADGQYAYTRAETYWWSTADTREGRAATAIIPRVRELWIGADGSGRVRETVVGDLVWLTEPDPELGDIFMRPDESDWSFGPGEIALIDTTFELTPERMAELSADPEALTTMIHEHAEQSDNPRDYESFVIVGDLLRGANLSPAFRAAVYEFAADIPNVELVGDVADSAGRPGIAVAMEHGGIRHELILDPQTAQLLEERDILISSGAEYEYVVESGTVLSRATYQVISGVVSSTSETP